jgi:hypothetical protein
MPTKFLSILLLLGLSGSPLLAWAQTGPGGYPQRTVRVIVPAATGSLTDPVARVIAEDMGRRTGQSWVIDNRPGAGGIIGTDATAKAAPDGYTLMLTANNFIITPALYRNVTYKVPADFSLIGMVGRGDNLLVASAASGLAWQYRQNVGGSGVVDAGPADQAAPVWVKLVRAANRFTGSWSPDGITWTEAGSITISMGPSALVGLASTSDAATRLNRVEFTDVAVSNAAPTVASPASAPTALAMTWQATD